MAPRHDESRWTELRAALTKARMALPAAAAAYAVQHPRSPDSTVSLASFEMSMEHYEFEMALYSLVGIAKEVGAGPEFWSAAEDAAGLMKLGSEWRKWEFPS